MQMNRYFILIPGRHHLITQFQANYITELVSSILADHLDVTSVECIWAITSANHTGTRRNPISGERRLGMIEYATGHMETISRVFTINNMRPKPDFAHYVIEDIRVQSDGDVAMTPDNTTVLCSTPAVISLYRELGFSIASAELNESTAEIVTARPWDVVERIVDYGYKWADSEGIKTLMYPPCWDYYVRYQLGKLLNDVYADPLVGSDDGDITETRDYASYRQAFEDNAWRKVAEFSDHVAPGRILDIGCATGQTLKLLADKPMLFESDFYGVEAARPLFQICEQRKSAGEFGDANVYFYQRNFMQGSLFDDDYFTTIITMALTHEIESYLGRDELARFVCRVFTMLAPGGTYINYDVVGPDDGDEMVYVKFRDDDGDNPQDVMCVPDSVSLQEWLISLSTAARFRRFRHDFRRDEGDTIVACEELVEGVSYIKLRRADLCEFLAKKDYTASWTSEMHERFCFFDHATWVEYLEAAGFEVSAESRAIQNPWLLEHRFMPAADVYVMNKGSLTRDETVPNTNTLLIARKPVEL